MIDGSASPRRCRGFQVRIKTVPWDRGLKIALGMDSFWWGISSV